MRRKKNSKSLRALKAKAWKLFSEWIRRKDADEGGTVECFTSGKLMHWKDAHAGHGIPGRHNAVLFDPDIVKPQSPVDNIWKGGQYHIFATKLIKEHGMEWWDQKLIDSRKVVKYTAADLEDLILDLKQKLNQLDKPSSLHSPTQAGTQTTQRRDDSKVSSGEREEVSLHEAGDH
jgi:hypothetical protein